MSTFHKPPFAVTLAFVLGAVGCQQTLPHAAQPTVAAGGNAQAVPHRTKVAAAAIAPLPTAPQRRSPSPQVVRDDTSSGLVQLAKTLPAEVNLGAEFSVEMTLRAQDGAANVTVRDTVPTELKFLRSDPAAIVRGNRLIWRLGNLDAGQTLNIKIWYQAQAEGSLTNGATVSSDPRVRMVTRVVKPAIKLTASQPENVAACDPIPILLVVQNVGSSQLTGVVVSNNLPLGWTMVGRRNLRFEAGTLAPGESRQFNFNAVAMTAGRYVNSARATAEQGVDAEAAAYTVVHQAVLALNCRTDNQIHLGRPFEVYLTLVNTGDATATNSQVVLPIPTGLGFRSATAGGHVSGNSLIWEVEALPANLPRELRATLTGNVPGSYVLNGTATDACAAKATSSAAVIVTGIPALRLEKADDPDPVAVGETTMLTIKITNQGSADAANVRMVVTLAPEFAPLSAPDGTIDGQTVTFPTVSQLAPKAAVIFKVSAKGIKAGDGRTRFSLTSDMLTSPVLAEESTHVY